MRPLRFDANLKWLYAELPFEARFDAAAAAGFEAVEFASPYEYSPASVRQWLTDAGLKLLLINTPMGAPGTLTANGSACLPDHVSVFRAGVERGLEYASALDAGMLHVVGGRRPPDLDASRAEAQFAANIAWAADLARGSGVRIVLEAQNKVDVPGFVIRDQVHAAQVVDAIDEPHVGVILDFYHTQVDEGDVLGAFDRLSKRVFHIQIADVPRRGEPGSGELEWPAIFEHLGDSPYGGWIGCEYRPTTASTSGSLGWRQDLAS